MKKLYKSTDRKIDGVCAGIAEFFGVDPIIIRVAYAVFTLFTVVIFGVALYAVLALVLPRQPFPEYEYEDKGE